MKILVTGGVGFIGTALIKKLLDEKHIVHSLDNYKIGCKENEIEGCYYHNVDIENIHLMDKDFDLIFHLAALSRIQPSFNKPEDTFRVNTIGTQKVCEFARYIGAKVYILVHLQNGIIHINHLTLHVNIWVKNLVKCIKKHMGWILK